jgi:beta-carotene 3-hydroxylase
MDVMTGIALLVATIVAMEGFAYATHRWVMHGPGWVLHRSHHQRHAGRFELNDLYAVMFSAPSVLLLYGGVHLGWGVWTAWVGAGIAGYGLIYAGFHDILVHRRIRHGYVPRSKYMKRIVQAHRLHHACRERKGAVSFGFIWAPRVSALKARLAAQRVKGQPSREIRSH